MNVYNVDSKLSAIIYIRVVATSLLCTLRIIILTHNISRESPILLYPVTFPMLLPRFAIHGCWSSCIYNIWQKSSISTVWSYVYLATIAWNVAIFFKAFSQTIHMSCLSFSIIAFYVVYCQILHMHFSCSTFCLGFLSNKSGTLSMHSQSASMSTRLVATLIFDEILLPSTICWKSW